MPSARSDPSPDAHRPDASRLEGYVALVVVQVFFGLFPLFIKLACDPEGGFAPRIIAVWRIVFAAGVLGAIVLARQGQSALPRLADVPRFLAAGLLGVVVNQVLAMEGISRSTVTASGLLMTLIPVFTYALAVLARQERFLVRRATGIAIALSGALLLMLLRGGPVDLRQSQLFGNVLIVSNCLSYAGFLIVVKPLLRRYTPLCTIAWVFVSSVWAAPLLAMEGEIVPEVLTPSARWGMAYTLVFPTVLAYLINAFALARVSASTAAVFIYLQPLIGGAAGFVVFGEELGPRVGFAALLLFVGIWLVTVSRAALPPSPGPASPGPASPGPASSGPASSGPASSGPASSGPVAPAADRGR